MDGLKSSVPLASRLTHPWEEYCLRMQTIVGKIETSKDGFDSFCHVVNFLAMGMIGGILYGMPALASYGAGCAVWAWEEWTITKRVDNWELRQRPEVANEQLKVAKKEIEGFLAEHEIERALYPALFERIDQVWEKCTGKKWAPESYAQKYGDLVESETNQLVHVKGDGSCWFYSFYIGLCDVMQQESNKRFKSIEEVKTDVLTYVNGLPMNGDNVLIDWEDEPIPVDKKTLVNELESVTGPVRQWGGVDALMAMANCYDVRVVIWALGKEGFEKASCAGPSASDKEIHVKINSIQHPTHYDYFKLGKHPQQTSLLG
ncbi:MAG: hypothetical protein KGI80_04490 [Verrucomicrobiota bacterium]|nr:hypothetical protein [Verrucomicrobiota bacterium]